MSDEISKHKTEGPIYRLTVMSLSRLVYMLSTEASEFSWKLKPKAERNSAKELLLHVFLLIKKT